MDQQYTFQGSKSGYRTQLNIFELPISDVSCPNSNYLSFTSSVTLKDSYNPVVFNIPASSNSYYDLFNSYIYIRVCKKWLL